MGACGSQFTSVDQSMGRQLFDDHIRTQLHSIKVYSVIGVMDQKWGELTSAEKGAWYLKGQKALNKLNINPRCSQPDVEFKKDYNAEPALSLETPKTESPIVEEFAFSMFKKQMEPQLQIHSNARYGFVDDVTKSCWSQLGQGQKTKWYEKAEVEIEKLKLEP